MTEIITATKEFSVQIIEHADLVIQNFNAPTEVESGEEFEVSYDAYNTGASDTCFGRIIDVDTDSEIVNSYWTNSVNHESAHTSVVVIPGSTTQRNLRIEVGYIK